MKIYILGIKGVAMSGLAVVIKQMGWEVVGSDVDEYFHTEDILKKNNIQIVKGFTPDNVSSDTKAMVITGAHGGFNNVEVKRALELNIPVYTHAQFIGQFMKEYENRIVVLGSHGKTTISAMISFYLTKTGMNPTYLVGTSDFSGLEAAHYGTKKYFVIEGDEYGNAPPKDIRPRFSFFPANWVVCPNIDFDHPDIYKDLEDTKEKFLSYYNKYKPFVIACGDDDNIRSLKNEVPQNNREIYGLSDRNDLIIYDLKETGETRFKLRYKGKELGEFELGIPGRQNICNVASVVLLFLKLGLDIEPLREVMKDFHGARRRFEKIYEFNGKYLYDDYAHHPKEIIETIKAAKTFFKDKKILIIFQPHTYSRTHALLRDFPESLKLADMTITTDIFASARENKADFPVESNDIEKSAFEKGYTNIRYVPIDSLISEISKIVKDFDVIFTMGAGDLYKKHKELCKLITPLNRQTGLTQTPEICEGLASHTTFRMGGEPEALIVVKTIEELKTAVKLSIEKNIKYYLLAGGSNTIFSDKKIGANVILNRIVEKKIISQSDTELVLEISSGYPLGKLIGELLVDGWSGFEWFAGMPGSIGGAVYMNSKWMREGPYFIGDNLISAQILDKNGIVKTVNKAYFNFSYGYSELQKNEDILLSAQFKFVRRELEELKTISQEVMAHRLSTQPRNGFTAGCFFKNVNSISAGKLIEEAGLKGRCIGQFYISNIHANFIIHKGNGKIEDLISLIDLIKTEVKSKYNVELQNEVEIIK